MSWNDDYSDYRRGYSGYPSSRYMPSPYRDDYFPSRHTRRDPYSHNYLYPDGTGPILPGPGLSNRRSSHSSGSRQLSRLARLPVHYGGDCYGTRSYDSEGMGMSMGMGYGRRGLGSGRRGFGGYGGGYDSVYD